jgi:hypothetical protein
MGRGGGGARPAGKHPFPDRRERRADAAALAQRVEHAGLRGRLRRGGPRPRGAGAHAGGFGAAGGRLGAR